MIFKNAEIYFLYAPSKKRWGATLVILLLIFSCWWLFAFVPLRAKLRLLRHKLENVSTAAHELDQQSALDALNNKAIAQRLAYVGDYNYFLNDLLQHGLTTTHLSVEGSDKLDGYTATSIKIDFTGSFNSFYQFLRQHTRNYLCLWNSCLCSRVADGALSIAAEIVIYSK